MLRNWQKQTWFCWSLSIASTRLDVSPRVHVRQARTVLDGLRAFTEAERLDGANK